MNTEGFVVLATLVLGLCLWFLVLIVVFAKTQRRLEATVNRMEAATKVVAADLASSVSRADAVEGPHGAAADAALRTGDTPEAIRKRQDEVR